MEETKYICSNEDLDKYPECFRKCFEQRKSCETRGKKFFIGRTTYYIFVHNNCYLLEFQRGDYYGASEHDTLENIYEEIMSLLKPTLRFFGTLDPDMKEYTLDSTEFRPVKKCICPDIDLSKYHSLFISCLDQRSHSNHLANGIYFMINGNTYHISYNEGRFTMIENCTENPKIIASDEPDINKIYDIFMDFMKPKLVFLNDITTNYTYDDFDDVLTKAMR